MGGKPAETKTETPRSTNGASAPLAPSEAAAQIAAALKAAPQKSAAVNPPEQSRGADLGAPANLSVNRVEMAARMAESLLSGAYNRHAYESPMYLAATAVTYADAILAELAKK
jgi:hypothetical protein